MKIKLICLLFLCLFSCKQEQIQPYIYEHEISVFRNQHEFFTYETMFHELLDRGLPYEVAEMFTKLAVYESGWGLNTKIICLKNHNYWGLMRNGYPLGFKSDERALNYLADLYFNHWNPDCGDPYVWLIEQMRWNLEKGYVENVKEVEFLKYGR